MYRGSINAILWQLEDPLFSMNCTSELDRDDSVGLLASDDCIDRRTFNVCIGFRFGFGQGEVSIIVDYSHGPGLLSWRPIGHIVYVIIAVVGIAVIALVAVVVVWAGLHLLVIGPVPLGIYGCSNHIRLPVATA